MAFSKSMTLLATLLVLLPVATFALDWSDISPSVATEICKEIECGKGTCSFNASAPMAYTCKCDSGWKRTVDGDDDLGFLPCVIPNCTLDYNGCQAPPKVPDYTEIPHNLSAFDPCTWVYCGEGTCIKNSTYLYTPECQCKSGATNLLGVSVYPCYKECTLQPDCAALGITVADSTSTNGTTTDSNKATDFMPSKFQLIAVVMMAAGMML